MQFITTHTVSRIFEITLNRPDKRNSLNSEFVAELISAFTAADEDENTRVIILKANGKVFREGEIISIDGATGEIFAAL